MGESIMKSTISRYKFTFCLFVCLTISLISIFPCCYASSKDSHINLKDDPKGTRPQSSSSTSPVVSRKEESKLLKGSSFNTRHKKSMDLETSENLVIKLSEDGFTSYLKRAKADAEYEIVEICKDETKFQNLLASPGWIVKLACHPASALKGLKFKGADFERLNKEESRYPSLLISTILLQPESEYFEKLFSLLRIPVESINKSFPANEEKKVEESIWKFIKKHKTKTEIKKPEISLSYWKALSVLIERKYPKALKRQSKNKKEIFQKIEEFLKDPSTLPPGFSLLFNILIDEENKLYALCASKGKSILYTHPEKALELLKLAVTSKYSERALNDLGHYYQDIGYYETATNYFSKGADSLNLLNLGSIHEARGQMVKAQELYETAGDHYLAKVKLLTLYKSQENKEKASEIRKKLVEQLNQLQKDKHQLKQEEAINAAVISLLLGNTSVTEEFINLQIGTHHLSSPTLCLMSAYVKHTLEKENRERKNTEKDLEFSQSPTDHLGVVKQWIKKLIESRHQQVNQKEEVPSKTQEKESLPNEPISSPNHIENAFPNVTPLLLTLIGPFKYDDLHKTSIEKILEDFEKKHEENLLVWKE